MSKPVSQSESTTIQVIKVSADASITSMNCVGRLSRPRIEEGIIAGIGRLGNTSNDPRSSAESRWPGEVILRIEDEVEPRSLHMDPAALEARIIEGAVAKIRDIAGPRGVELCSLKLIAEVRDVGSSGNRSIVGCVVGFDLDDSAVEPVVLPSANLDAFFAQIKSDLRGLNGLTSKPESADAFKAERRMRAAVRNRWQ